jgi:uncharacterized protein
MRGQTGGLYEAQPKGSSDSGRVDKMRFALYFSILSQRRQHMIRDDLKAAMITAMKAKDEKRVSTLRMAQAAIKNKDIELRTSEAPADDNVMVIDVLSKMVKQRRESADIYAKNNRPDAAAAELAEIAMLEEFLPKAMSDDDALAAIKTLVAEIGATSVKDMGKVMGLLKERFAGQIDMGKAGGLVKQALGN